jgi:hypothetical protein
MRKIIFGVLLFSIIISCQKEEENLNPISQDPKNEIIYDGKSYSSEVGAQFFKDESIPLSFDFEPNRTYLFDNKNDALNYVKLHFNKYYNQISMLLIGNLESLKDKEDGLISSKNGRLMISPSDFGIQIVDRECSSFPPYQIFNVNVASYPNGTIGNIFSTTGYFARSFGFTVPSGGSITVQYSNFPNISCPSTTYLTVTQSQCHDVFYIYPGCFGGGTANTISWSLIY